MGTSSAEVEVAFTADLARSPRWLIVKRSLLNIELACAIQSFSYGLHGLIITNLYISKACRINLNLPHDVCDDINKHDEENNEVERIVTALQLYSTFLYSIPCMLISMAIGSWSDRNGRKPVLIFPVIGFIVSQLVYILNVYFSSARAEYLLFANLYSLFGGNTAIFLGIYSYIADITTPQARTSRISLLSVMTTVGWTSGNLLSPYLFRSYGYYGTFIASIILYVIVILYITFFIKESRVIPPESSSSEPASLKKFFSSAKDVIHSALRPREGFQRCLVILLLLTMLLLVAGECGGLGYLFTRKMFAWDERTYTQVSSLTTILSTMTNLLLLPLLSYKLSVPDSIIGIMASLSTLADTLVTALAQTGKIYIFAKCLGIMSSQASMVIRSLLSKTVSSAELGKVYSLLGCLENIIPLAMTPLMTLLYNNTLDIYPGAVYVAAAGIMAVAFCCFVAIAVLLKKEEQFQVLDNQIDEDI